MSLPKKAGAPGKTKEANAAKSVAGTSVVDEPLDKPLRPQTWWDRILFYVQLRDSIWSIPLFFLFVHWVGNLLVGLYGPNVGAYDPSFIQALFMTGCVIVFLGGITEYCIYYNWRSVQRYFKGVRKPAEGIIHNASKIDYAAITPWQRLKISFCVHCLYFIAGLVVFLELI